MNIVKVKPFLQVKLTQLLIEIAPPFNPSITSSDEDQLIWFIRTLFHFYNEALPPNKGKPSKC